jgi:hypothetical protein
VQRTSSVSRVLGRTAVGAVVAAAALVPAGGAPAWAESPAAVWTVDTSAPSGLLSLGGGGWMATVPLNVCSVEWTVTGGPGGSGSGAEAGGTGGELRVTTRGTAGATVALYPGTAGRAWADGGAGGTNGSDGAGVAGASDGAGGGGGGGGGSEVRFGTTLRLLAHGGDGGGATGGVGGATRATPSGNAVDPGSGGPVTAEVTADGAAASGSGAGVVRGVGIPCPATAPGAPRMVLAGPVPEDGVIRLVFEPETPRAHEVWAPVTGWEVSLDGTATWRPLDVTAAPADLFATPVEGLLQGLVRDLPNGYYPVAVRALSAAGPSPSGGVRPVRLVGTPTAVTVSDVGVVAGVSSLRVSWSPPSGTVYGGYVAESYDAAQDGENTPFSLCETTVDEHSCVLAAEPGRSYRVVVSAGGGRGAAPVTSGVVAAPPVPAQVPTSSGTLDGPGAGAVTAGQTVDVAGAGYLAGSTVTVVVYSTPTVLGSLVADDGSFDTSVTLPSVLPTGEHTLVATGVGPDGETWTLTRRITAQGPAAGPAAPATTATTVATAVPSAGGLAYTGAYVGVMAIGGVLTLVVGVALVLLGRRRRTTGRG